MRLTLHLGSVLLSTTGVTGFGERTTSLFDHRLTVEIRSRMPAGLDAAGELDTKIQECSDSYVRGGRDRWTEMKSRDQSARKQWSRKTFSHRWYNWWHTAAERNESNVAVNVLCSPLETTEIMVFWQADNAGPFRL